MVVQGEAPVGVEVKMDYLNQKRIVVVQGAAPFDV